MKERFVIKKCEQPSKYKWYVGKLTKRDSADEYLYEDGTWHRRCVPRVKIDVRLDIGGI